MNTSSMIRIVISSLLMAIFSQTCPAQVAVEIKGTVRSVTGGRNCTRSYYRCRREVYSQGPKRTDAEGEFRRNETSSD